MSCSCRRRRSRCSSWSTGSSGGGGCSSATSFLRLLVESVLGALLGEAVISDWTPLKGHLLARWGFPELRLAGITAILVVSGPELVRPARRLASALVLLAALGVVALGAALPSAALAGLAFGLGGAAAVRLALGTVAGVPPSERVREQLTGSGSTYRDLRPAERQRVGSAAYVGHDARRQAASRSACSAATLRTPSGSLAAGARSPTATPATRVAVGRVEQVEHEALATLMAGCGRCAGTGGHHGRARLLRRRADRDTPARRRAARGRSTTFPTRSLSALWKEVASLQAARISHGRLNLRNVAVVDGKPMLIEFSARTLGAPQTALDIDVAELLVSSTVLVGPERALAAAIRGIGDQRGRGRAAVPGARRADTPHARPRPSPRRRAQEAPRVRRRGDPRRSCRSSPRCAASGRATSSSPR